MIEININTEKCTGCGDCVKACPLEIIYMENNLCNVHRNLLGECLTCQSCVVVCPSGAVTVQD
ncbi:MAG: indolepyruvate ferredoxin oxidoreductase subunit alpha [Bacillota bacterium]